MILYSPNDRGIVMNAELLRLVSIGSGRRDHYAKKLFLETHAEATMSQKVVGLSSMVSTSKKGEVSQAKVLKLATSTSSKELQVLPKPSLFES
jgi:hypothetical protein